MFNLKSSSYFILNNDNKLNYIEKLIWVILCFINIYNPLNYFVKIKNSFIHSPKDINLLIKENKKDRVPVRTSCDLFLNDFPWKKIENKIGSLNIVDIGCGKGSYLDILSKYSMLNISSYTGVDVKKNEEWIKYGNTENINFFVGSSSEIDKFSNIKSNFFFSHSAVEHIKEDMNLFRKISEISYSGKKIVQLHLFPSPRCLYTYGFHGIRQYSNLNLKRILNALPKNSESFLIGLGGPKTSNIQFNYMYLPIIKNLGKSKDFLDRRYDNLNIYHEKLKESIILDSKNKCKFEKASFYALVTFFNFKHDLKLDFN